MFAFISYSIYEIYCTIEMKNAVIHISNIVLSFFQMLSTTNALKSNIIPYISKL